MENGPVKRGRGGLRAARGQVVGGGLVNGVEPEGVQGGFGSGVVVHGAE